MLYLFKLRFKGIYLSRAAFVRAITFNNEIYNGKERKVITIDSIINKMQ